MRVTKTNNAFNTLGDSDDSEYEYEEEEEAETSEFLTCLDLNNEDEISIFLINRAVDKCLKVDGKNKHIFAKNFNTTYEQYETLMNERLDCFKGFEMSTSFKHFEEKIKPLIKDDDIRTIRKLYESAVEALSRPSPRGHGALFILGYIASNYPQFISNEIFGFNSNQISKFSPVFCWILSKAARDSKLSLTNQMLNIFEPYFRSKESVVITVTGAYILSWCFNHDITPQTPNVLLSSKYYALLRKLCYDTENPSYNFVKPVLFPHLVHIRVTDKDELPTELIKEFPFPIPPIVAIFEYQSKVSDVFLKGWKNKALEKYPYESLQYLDSFQNEIPVSVSKQFGEEFLLKGGMKTILAAKKLRQRSVSIRFSAILIFAVILYLLYYFGSKYGFIDTLDL